MPADPTEARSPSDRRRSPSDRSRSTSDSYKSYRHDENSHRRPRSRSRERTKYPASYRGGSPGPLSAGNKTPLRPTYKSSGILEKQSNNIQGTQLKYTPASDAISPNKDHRKYYLYHYTSLDTKEPVRIPLRDVDHFIVGRDASVCDIVPKHSSVSKQHAAIQFRKVGSAIRPYVIDLESINGTYLNENEKELPVARFVELINGDVLRFGDYEGEFVVVFD